jgi:hypothetical protein
VGEEREVEENVGEEREGKETNGCPLILARQVLCISFTLIYIFSPWLDLSGVFSSSQ